MEEENYYENRLDKIFVKGSLWKHRTFRTIFDPPSSEWHYTSLQKKIEILERVVEAGENLQELISDYKERYLEQGRRDIAMEVETALAILLQYKLENRQPDK